MAWSELSKWIWMEDEQQKDSYGEFVSEFSYTAGDVAVKISVDSNYAIFVNGDFAGSEQYPDFPHYKVYDEIDITKFCRPGNNRIAILAWYYGEVFMTYYPGKAALRFEVCCGEELLAFSDEATQSRRSPSYQSGLCHSMTPQLGYGFCYDATKEDDWKLRSKADFSASFLVEQNLNLFKRSIQKTVIGKRVEATLVKQEENIYLFDLGREEVGYLTLKVASPAKQKLTICFGEHIADGWVRREIGGREFWVDVVIGEGETSYTNYCKRFGCRYLEVHAETPLDIEYVSLLTCAYPLQAVCKSFKNPLHQKIYDVSVRTLTLCLHDHYEDCPWREQGLYAMDSRNQMLCGYYAFKEYAVPRDNLYLMSQVDREDNLLSICIPTSFEYAIPSYSLYYIMAVYEYTIHSKDTSLVKEIMPKLRAIMKTFTDRIEGGLITNFVTDKKPGYWNFYEWRQGLNGYAPEDKKIRYDAVLNCLLSIALKNLQALCDSLSIEASYGSLAETINEQIHKMFYRPETGLYANNAENDVYSELANALAVVCGAATGETAKHIGRVLAGENALTDISLSMACFKYDALLMIDQETYGPVVVQLIEKVYEAMLSAGATAFWEDEAGSDAFAGAGSLCHGWSAIPAYYLHILDAYL